MSDAAAAGGDRTASAATKKARLDESVSAAGEERDIDAATQKALEEIDANQNEIDLLNEKASEEILKVEQKYNKLRKPFYEKRNEIIQKIPKFWLTAFINHPQISSVIEEDEEDALQYLNKLEVEEFEDIKSGYRIKLFFDANPYFENDALVKEFHLGSSGDSSSQSTPIQWKEGQDLSAKAAMKSAAISAAGGKASRKRALELRTFFSWFCDNVDPSCDDIAEVIKDDMWLVGI
jgi:template-activating factor I